MMNQIGLKWSYEDFEKEVWHRLVKKTFAEEIRYCKNGAGDPGPKGPSVDYELNGCSDSLNLLVDQRR